MSTLSASRKLAFQILLELERATAHSDNLLRARAVSRLSPADRHLTTALVLGVLRWALVLDAAYRPLLQKPNAKLDIEVRIALRLGAFQILQMDRIPARAAIDESVELTKFAGRKFSSGLVNAVLRKLAAQPRCSFEASDAYPAWMTERWRRIFGAEAAEAICRHGQTQPMLALRLASADAEQELCASGVALEAGELLRAARRVSSGDVTGTPAILGHRARVQDEGSQLVAELACAARADEILDACAAPGGKTLILAERHPQARIVANEASAQRLEPLRRRMQALSGRVTCRLGDAAALAEENVYDLALVDAPCSGTGTLGRNPEIRYRLTEEELARQAERQRAILASSLRAVRPGGRLVYSTCSFEPEENEEVVAAALQLCSGVRLVSARVSIEELEQRAILQPGAAERLLQAVTPEGMLRLRPGEFSCDGFFVAIFAKQ